MTSENETQGEQEVKKSKGWIKYATVLAVVVLCIIGFYIYVKYTEIYPSTEDAYVNANTVYISAQVTGKVDKIYVEDNQAVKKGQLLLTIEPQSFEYALQEAKANLALAEQQIQAIEDSIRLEEAKLKEAEAQEFVARQKQKRISKLVAQNMSSKESGDEALGDYNVAVASVNAAKASISQQKRQLVLQASKIEAEKSQVETAKLNLSYTKIYAPTSGYITNFSLRPGSMINQNQSLFVLVSNTGFWVDANYKETQMERMKAGQSAEVVLDMYPNVTLHGVVESISSGSGSVFSLLPPENASGNWVKVTQRFPVKVIIDPKEIKKVPQFRVGASASVTIDTRSK
ncbi:HlyD family secretion protein [Fangia hongkongensis]|uniref:HlyD family secretion protein n=1 Tax=Fangia hongkongensis TaxID=270495 RepID=UPI00037CB4A0|nr:HlyD family secretion protein [Fangia hongkongensis]MBK2124917.1 HlyD family secretion protein [Fangia hongkongensis]